MDKWYVNKRLGSRFVSLWIRLIFRLRQAGLTREEQQTHENVNQVYEEGRITLSLSLLTCQYFDEKYYQKLVDAEADMPIVKPRKKSKAT